MSRQAARFTFQDDVPLADVESTLLLAIMGAESLHGSARVRLQTDHYLDAETRRCVIDTSDPVGRDLAQLFTGFLMREYGPESFSIERAGEPTTSQPDKAAD